MEAVLSCRVLGGHWGCCSPALPSLGWRLGGGRALRRTPPIAAVSHQKTPPIPMEAAAKFLNHIGGCHPQTVPGMR